jgi:hypothetical protein
MAQDKCVGEERPRRRESSNYRAKPKTREIFECYICIRDQGRMYEGTFAM